MKLKCVFCGETLDTERFKDIGVVSTCPRCGAVTVLTLRENEEQAREVAVKAVKEAQGGNVPVTVVSVFPKADMPEVMVQAWSPEELLNIRRVAQILGLSQSRVSEMLSEQEKGTRVWFPGAYRRSSRPKRYKRGRWKIPRRALREYLTRKKA